MLMKALVTLALEMAEELCDICGAPVHFTQKQALQSTLKQLEEKEANPGIKVMFVGATDDQVKWGANDDPRTLLTLGAIYTVGKKEIHSFHTKLELVEFPGKKFNSVSFVEIPKDPTTWGEMSEVAVPA